MSSLIPVVLALSVLLIFTGTTRPVRQHAPLPRFTGFTFPSSRSLIAASALAVPVFILVAGITRAPMVGLAIAAAAGTIPISRDGYKGAKARFAVRDQWPDALATLIAAVRAGVSLPQACLDLAARCGPALRPGFDRYAGVYRSTGSFSIALNEMRQVLDDPVGDRVCISLSIAHEVGGGDLVRILRALSEQVRDEQRTRREVVARWSWTLTAARVAALAPWIVLAIMAIRPEAASAYRSATGATVISIGAVLTILGYRLMLRAGRLPEQGRLR